MSTNYNIIVITNRDNHRFLLIHIIHIYDIML